MRSFLGFPQVAYLGSPTTRAIKLGGISSQTIPLLFDWIAYGVSSLTRPNISVLVNVENSQCKALEQILSIYIDNLGSDVPIYVYFPDTTYTVVAKPNSEGWYPAYTNSKTLWVIGEGFLTGSIPQTSIMLCNVSMEANVNDEIDNAVALWRASPSPERSSLYNTSLGTPALGDQLFSSDLLNLTIPGANVDLFLSPYFSGFIYLTSLVVVIPLLYQDNPPTKVISIVIESTGVSGTLIAPRFISAVQTANIPVIAAQLPLIGLQTKLNAAEQWRARTVDVSDQGFAQIYASFTHQPN